MMSPGNTGSESLTRTGSCVGSLARITSILLRDARSVNPPPSAMARSIVSFGWYGIPPGFRTSPFRKNGRYSAIDTVTAGLRR